MFPLPVSIPRCNRPIKMDANFRCTTTEIDGVLRW